ncbi:MAG: DNA repair protein RecO [Paracoccaceae bacterium]|nr:MAG: DNA repair protein RecO [Alphaproteobacteria bacterium]GIX12096.1 MAG: DNA repair protein RecO [Paracoccaceae bacterium]
MEWTDEGIVVACRRHGEDGAIVELFTPSRGRHAGYVPGGAGRRLRPVLQPGAQVAATWRARLAEQTGIFRIEPVRPRAALLFEDPPALAALASVAALLSWALPEREPHPALYGATVAVMDRLGAPGWQAAYARWELSLLRELGFGPDLSACAVTGGREGLAHVSPRSGRAVSRAAAGRWADRLLPLPAFLTGPGPEGPGEVAAALEMTGFFLEHWLGAALERRALPGARIRLAEMLARSGRIEDQHRRGVAADRQA